MTKKGLELFPSDRDCALSLMFLLVLLSTEVDAVMQKRCCKVNMVEVFGPSNSKMILTLLTKVIIFYVRLTTIDVRGFGLQWLLTGIVRGGSLGFEDRPEDFLQILFYILSNKRLNSRGVSWGLVMARFWRG